MVANRESITLYVSRGLPGDGDLNLRFDPEYGEEIRELLDEHGIAHGGILEHAAGPELLVEAVHVLRDPALLLALAQVLKIFFHRHDGKKVVTADGEEISGYSPKQVEDMLRRIRDDQAKQDDTWRRMTDSASDGRDNVQD